MKISQEKRKVFANCAIQMQIKMTDANYDKTCTFLRRKDPSSSNNYSLLESTDQAGILNWYN